MNNIVNLKDKRILVVSEQLCDGNAVKQSDLRKKRGGVIVNKIKILGADVVGNVYSDIESIEEDMKKIVAESGTFDGVVFAITHSDFRPLSFVTPLRVSEIMDINYGAFVEVMRVLKKSKGLSRGASVVAMSSISSFAAQKAKMAFCSAKAALDVAVKCLTLELADMGIRINSIQKDAVVDDFNKEHIQSINVLNEGAASKRQPLGLVQAEEIANMVAFLLSDATKTMTGTSIVIDGGYTL